MIRALLLIIEMLMMGMMTTRNRAKALKKKEELRPDEGTARKADQEPVFPQVPCTKKRTFAILYSNLSVSCKLYSCYQIRYIAKICLD